MLKKIRSVVLKIFKILFPISFIVAVSIDAYYKFDIQDTSPGYAIALFAYIYFCFYLAVPIFRRILESPGWLIKFIQYLCLWVIAILVLDANDPITEGLLASVDFVIILISFFAVVLLTLYFLYVVIFKNLKKILVKFFRLLFIGIVSLVIVSLVGWLIGNEINKKDNPKIVPTPVTTTLIQPWQLNSRYKISNVIKFLKVDLDKDGKEELVAITSYDKTPYTVFYYAGFYRYNPATEIWDEYYGEELNVLYYKLKDKDIENSELAEFNEKLVTMWSTEFTTLENLGDLTGDGCPEIAFTALIQGKYYDNYIIIAQAGESHYRFKIFSDQNSFAQVISEDGLLIEKYNDDIYEYKDIFEWDSKNLRFKLIESQKSKITTPETPKVIPGYEELSS